MRLVFVAERIILSIHPSFRARTCVRFIHMEFLKGQIRCTSSPLSNRMRTNQKRWSLTLISCAAKRGTSVYSSYNKNEVLLFITNSAWCIVKFLSIPAYQMFVPSNWSNLPFSTRQYHDISSFRAVTIMFSSRRINIRIRWDSLSLLLLPDNN